MKAQEKDLLDELLKETDKLLMKETDAILKHSNKTLADNKAMDKAIAFALEQWKTNKRWFREEPGRVTTEDVIKMCIEFAWMSKANFDYTYNSEKGK